MIDINSQSINWKDWYDACVKLQDELARVTAERDALKKELREAAHEVVYWIERNQEE